MLNRLFLCMIPPTPPTAYPFSRSIQIISITMIIHVPSREAKHIRPVSGTVHGVPHPYKNFNFHTEICKKSLASLARRRRISTPNSTYLINDIVHQLFWVFLALLPMAVSSGAGRYFRRSDPWTEISSGGSDRISMSNPSFTHVLLEIGAGGKSTLLVSLEKLNACACH